MPKWSIYDLDFDFYLLQLWDWIKTGDGYLSDIFKILRNTYGEPEHVREPADHPPTRPTGYASYGIIHH